ncbi:hypothetical protein [Burkholderia ubonensis]|uniref:hypothetical protein n=1 Tax=Burkholderia ubonensis TaxID=101571 RepID=UPI00145464C1|nr:hypothetical protein [Burkholderia ubonensis]VWB36012.1 hypothetical protein BUB20358_01559 [Burkholderia ubonensis]
MQRRFAAFYTPDDDLEHALRVFDPIQYMNSGISLYDIGFNPSTQGTIAPGLVFTPTNSVPIVGAAYSPVDDYRYLFFPTTDNIVFYSRFPRDLRNPAPDPIFGGGVGSLPMMDPLQGYGSGGIVDLTAFYSSIESKLYVVVLMNNGDLWTLSGTPWTSNNPIWDEIPFLLQRVTGGKAITGFDGAGWNHAFISTDRTITEVYFNFSSGESGSDKIWTFDSEIVDISGFFSSEDGVAHVISATTTENGVQSEINEVTFVPAQIAPSTRLLKTVPFSIRNIGAYEKPDTGRHVIMMSQGETSVQDQLFLSWYYPGWNHLAYAAWPPLHTRF